MLLWDLFLQVHTAIGNLQGESASFHGRITVGKAVRICGAVENETGRSETIINEAELAAREDIVFDPQTSGGLLLSIDSQDAGKAISRLSSLSLPCAVIGRVINLQKKHLVFVK